MKRISVIFGTRPEAIKLAPVIRVLRDMSSTVVDVCVTGQHREMLRQVLQVFDIVPDRDMALMEPSQSLCGFSAKCISAVDDYLAGFNPHLVIVQGDTATAYCGAFCAFARSLRVAHVEAGLRTNDRRAPFPEEVLRRCITQFSDLHLAPTEMARANLLAEKVPDETVFVTGNTVVDAVREASAKIRTGSSIDPILQGFPNSDYDRSVLITCHRRENLGSGIDQICRAIQLLSSKFKNVEFLFPVHLNPEVRGPVQKHLSGMRNVRLLDPLGYLELVYVLERCFLVLTDSGGIQEEAPYFGKPVLVMRETTERPEAVLAGTSSLVGTDTTQIVAATQTLLTDPARYDAMARAVSPYGTGYAAERIGTILSQFFAENP